MSAHLLADSGDGEVPYTPRAVAHAAGTAPRGQDPVEALSHGLLGVAGLCLDERGRTVASPRCCPCSETASCATKAPSSKTLSVASVCKAAKQGAQGATAICPQSACIAVSFPSRRGLHVREAYCHCCCRLMEAAAWASARWADSYLMPDEAASEGLQSSFGAKGGSGPQVVAVLLQIANTLLSQCVLSATL